MRHTSLMVLLQLERTLSCNLASHKLDPGFAFGTNLIGNSGQMGPQENLEDKGFDKSGFLTADLASRAPLGPQSQHVHPLVW